MNKKRLDEWTEEIIQEADRRGISPRDLLKMLVGTLGTETSIFLHMLKCGTYDEEEDEEEEEDSWR